MLLIDNQLQMSGRMESQNLAADTAKQQGSNNNNDSQDVVDFVTTPKSTDDKYSPFLKHRGENNNNVKSTKGKIHFDFSAINRSRIPGTLYGDCEPPSPSISTINKPSFPTLLRSSRKKSLPIDTNTTTNNNNNTTSTTTTNNHTASAKEKPKFIKSASIARLFGNTYSTKKCDVQQQLGGQQQQRSRPFPQSDRFQRCDSDDVMGMPEFGEKKDLSAKALRTISRSISKLLWRQSHSVDISVPDPEFKVSYLGNVLTGWARGDGCVEKPINTLWRNYTQNNKPDVVMRIRVCPSGLKATTRQHGLTEYWSHRITYCCAPKNYPRVFCWVYRHEGRKLKHEMRCHAVLCAKESQAQQICNTLKENVARALMEFKKDKINRQNARLSLANSVYDNPSMPRRKIMLSVGGNNYRPPLERSKSAPKLMAIEEAISEEEEDNNTEEQLHTVPAVSNAQRPSCCRLDPLYPSMTLGRRKCRRGHSIRRTGPRLVKRELPASFEQTATAAAAGAATTTVNESTKTRTKSTSSLDSEDDFEKLLRCNNYDSTATLAGELMSYFDMKLLKPCAQSMCDLQNASEQDYKSLTQVQNAISLDDLDNYTDDETDEVFFNQDTILDLLAKQSLNDDGDKAQTVDTLGYNKASACQSAQPQQPHGILSISQNHPVLLDSDEGSISSGCETASTVTTSLDENQHHSLASKSDSDGKCCNDEDEYNQVNIEPVGEKGPVDAATRRFGFARRLSSGSKHRNHDADSDSELSDESGYVEFQEHNAKTILV